METCLSRDFLIINRTVDKLVIPIVFMVNSSLIDFFFFFLNIFFFHLKLSTLLSKKKSCFLFSFVFIFKFCIYFICFVKYESREIRLSFFFFSFCGFILFYLFLKLFFSGININKPLKINKKNIVFRIEFNTNNFLS